MSTHTEILARAFQLQASGVPEKKAMQRAGREIARREKRRGKAAAVGAPTPLDGSSLPSRAHAELATVLHRWVERIWSRPKRKLGRVIPKGDVQPPITTAPIVTTDEPAQLTTDAKLRAAFPAVAPLVVASGSTARLIPDTEFSQRYRDPVTASWRQSIEDNARLQRYREEQSRRHRAQSRYIG
jgi:hypothetical protein